LVKSRELVALQSAALAEYSFGALNDIDATFINFFNAFEQYKIDLANWNARYGQPPAASAPVTTGTVTTTPTTTSSATKPTPQTK
jgi:hypothetical protein